mgnify:CR=1 FL=1
MTTPLPLAPAMDELRDVKSRLTPRIDNLGDKLAFLGELEELLPAKSARILSLIRGDLKRLSNPMPGVKS